MGSDRFSSLRCLTERGWQTLDEAEELPSGWVRVYEVESYQGSPFGRQSYDWKECRTNPQRTTEEADALERTFPRQAAEWSEPSPELLKFLKPK